MGEIRASDARGQLIAAHDPRAEIWTDETTADTADTIPGRVVPPAAGSAGRMVATGDQEGSDTIGLKVLRGGSVGSRVEVGWKKTADTLYHGVNSPTVPTWSESVKFTTVTSTTSQLDSPRAVTLDDQRIVCVVSQYSSAFTSTTKPNYYITIRSTAGVWSTVSQVYGNPTYGGGVAVPTYVGCPGLAACLCVMDDSAGSVMLYTVTHEQLANATIAQVAVVRSTQADLQLSWITADGPITANSECLPAGITTSASDQFAIQAVAHAGQVSLILQHETTIYQYASSDGGYTFVLVGTVTAPRLSTADLAVVQGVFILSYTEGVNVKIRRIASAFDVFGDVTAITVATLKSSGSCGVTRLAVTDDDRLWLYAYDNDTYENLYAYYSSAAGASGTWVSIVTTAGGLIEGARVARGGAFALSNPGVRGGASWCVVPHRGRIGLMYRAANAAGADNSMNLTFLGGYADLVMPYRDEKRDPLSRVSWAKCWLPHEHIGDNLGEAFAAGSDTGLTETYLTGALEQVVTDGSTSVYWQVTSTAMLARGAGLMLGTASAVTAGIAYYRLDAQNSANNYSIEVFQSPTGIGLTDRNSAASLGTATIAGLVEIVAWVRDNVCSAYYRAWADGDGSQWTRLGGSAALTAATATSAAYARVAVTQSTTWRSAYVGLTVYESAAALRHTSLGVGITPTGGAAREAPIGLSLTPRAQYLVDGVYLSGHGGPLHLGEVWSVASTSTYAVERAACDETYPSPRTRWRSSTTTDSMRIAYKFGAESETILSSSWVVVIDGNLPACRFAWHDGSSWLSDIPLTRHISIAGTRAGSIVTPTTSGVSTVRYVDTDELVGGYVDMGAGDVRRIVENTAGAIQAPTGVAASMARIRVSDTDATEGSTGTWRLVFPRSVHLIHTGSHGTYRGFRITITTSTDSAQPPPEGYFEASILAGPAWPVPHQHGRDTVRVHRPRAVTTAAADGTRRTHRLADPETLIELHWEAAPRNMSDWYIDAATADYYPPAPDAGAPGSAAEGETMSTLRGFVDRYGSSGAAVAYVATYNRTTALDGTPEHLLTHRQYGAIVGTIEGEWRTQHTGHGDEQYTEVIRGGTVRIRSL